MVVDEVSMDVVSFRPHSLHGSMMTGNRRYSVSSTVNTHDIDTDIDGYHDVLQDDDSQIGDGEHLDVEKKAEEVSITEETLMEFPEGGTKAYITLFGCFCGLVSEFGLWNSSGAIESYIATHMLADVNTTSISMIFALFSFFVMFGTMVSGVVFDKYGGKKLCMTGTVLVTGGLMATANCTKLYQFILAYGVVCGIGCSLLTAPFVTSISHFFAKKRGMALSIVMPGASLGGVIWPLVCRSMYVKVGFQWTMRTLGFCIGFLLIVATLCVNDRHEEVLRIKILNEGQQKENLSFMEKMNDLIDFSTFKDTTFLILTGALFLNEFSLLMVSTYIPSYALNKGFSESLSLLALTVFNAAGILGRIIPTFLTDRYGSFNVIIILSLIMTLSIWILWLPFGAHLGVFMAFTVIFGFAVAGTLALTPLCTSAISRPKDFGKRYGTAYFFVSFCNLISLPVGMALTETKGGYNAMVAFGGATCTLTTLCFCWSRYRVGGLKPIKI